jgi:uncharacterized protein (TIGR02271 family)
MSAFTVEIGHDSTKNLFWTDETNIPGLVAFDYDFDKLLHQIQDVVPELLNENRQELEQIFSAQELSNPTVKVIDRDRAGSSQTLTLIVREPGNLQSHFWTDHSRTETLRVTDETVVPVAAEHLEVGKRTIDRGSVRVHSHVVETPVEEQVQLREETVQVERRPVDRPVGDVSNAFQERSIEVRETVEEPVVAKTARVTEEVVISKNVEERVQTVSDTVRRTEVEVEDTRAGGRTERAVDTDRQADAGRTNFDRTR